MAADKAIILDEFGVESNDPRRIARRLMGEKKRSNWLNHEA